MPIIPQMIAHLVETFGLDRYDSDLMREFLNVVEKERKPPSIPKPSETLAITISSPKTSALAYDRVIDFVPDSERIPEEIGFNCGTDTEQYVFYHTILSRLATSVGTQQRFQPSTEIEIRNSTSMFFRDLHRDIIVATDSAPSILFDSHEMYSKEFPLGPQQVLTGALQHVAMVDEKALSWDQVLEFRKDSEARAKYRRIIRWLDDELKSKSPEELQDIIAIRLDDYEWSVKKHGFKTVLGSLSCVLDPKFLASAAAVVGASTLAGGELWAALSSATLTFGGVAVSFGKSYVDALDERRKDNFEVAYIHDIKKAAK